MFEVKPTWFGGARAGDLDVGVGGHVALAVRLHHVGLGGLLHLPRGGGVLRHPPSWGRDRETAWHLGTATTLQKKLEILLFLLYRFAIIRSRHAGRNNLFVRKRRLTVLMRANTWCQEFVRASFIFSPQQRPRRIEYFEYLSWNWNFNNRNLFVLYPGFWSESPPRMAGTIQWVDSCKNAKIVSLFFANLSKVPFLRAVECQWYVQIDEELICHYYSIWLE